MKILIATPAYGGMVHQNYVYSFLRTFVEAAEEGHQIGVYMLGNESDIRRARNRLASAVAEGDHDKLLFIDADIGWTWSDVKKLIESDKKIIGGACPLKMLPITLNFNVFESCKQYFEGRSRTPESMKRMATALGQSEIAVPHLGTAFLMIDRKVLDDLKPHVPEYSFPDHTTGQTLRQWDFFPNGVIDKFRENDYLTEDFGFCWLAARHGFRTYLHTGVTVTHTGSYTFIAASK